MRDFRPLTVTLLCAGLLALMPSCSFIRRVTAPAGHQHKVIDDTARQAQANIELGEYQKALEIYAKAYDRYHYPRMSSGYAKTGERTRNAADTAYQKKEFAEAVNIYTILFESGITTRDFSRSLSFGDDYLEGQMKACSKALLESGLTKYREGKLEEAISIWKKALVFDQDNKEIKTMIDTATTQLQNLKNIK